MGGTVGYTTEELLLAAKVRELAVKLRAESFDLERSAKEHPMTGEEAIDWLNSPDFEKWRTDWGKRNPLEVFLEDAFKRITDAAAFIDGRQSV